MENLLNLPIYEALITDSEDGMFCVSLVDEPAVESNFLKFNKEKQKLMKKNYQNRQAVKRNIARFVKGNKKR